MSVVIRPATVEDDLDAAGQLVRASYLSLPDYPVDDAYDTLLADVRGRLDEALVVLALIDDRPVACATYVAGPGSIHHEFDDVEAATFRYFGVADEARGSGVGERLVRWMIDRARDDGRTRVRIHTLECMHAAMRLYVRLGFIRTPDHDHDFDGIVGVAYAFEL